MTANRFVPATLAAIAAAAAGGAASAGERDAGSPARLVVEQAGGMVSLIVRGAASDAVGVRYELDVDGASTVRQRGGGELRAGGHETLARVSINAGTPWRAVLRVAAGGQQFEQVEQSGPAG